MKKHCIAVCLIMLIFFISYFLYNESTHKNADLSLFHHVFSSGSKHCVGGDFVLQTTSKKIPKDEFIGNIRQKKEDNWIVSSYSLESFEKDATVVQTFCVPEKKYIPGHWSSNLYHNAGFAYYNKSLLQNFFDALSEKKREDLVFMMKNNRRSNYLLPSHIPINIFSFSINDNGIHGIGFDSESISLTYYRLFKEDNSLVYKHTPLFFFSEEQAANSLDKWDDCYIDPSYAGKERKCYTFFEAERNKYQQEEKSFFDEYSDIIKQAW